MEIAHPVFFRLKLHCSRHNSVVIVMKLQSRDLALTADSQSASSAAVLSESDDERHQLQQQQPESTRHDDDDVTDDDA